MRGRLRLQRATRPWRPLPLEPGAVHVQCSAPPRPPWQECIEIETHSALWMARPRAPEPCLRQSRLSRQQESELAKSYSQLQAQIEKLQAEAEALKAKELEGVIARIRTAIEHYGITPDQLFGRAKKAVAGRAAAKKAPARKSAAKGRPVAIKYRDGNDTWTGRGNKPRWLVARLAEGKQLADFAVS